MPKLNLDDIKYEPIELSLEGKTYVVGTITVGTLNKITEIAKEKTPDSLRKQLAVFFSVPEDTFKETDIRLVAQAVNLVTEEFAKQLTPSKPGAM